MIILISAKQGSGKTTLADSLCKEFPNSHHVKFADVLYEMHDVLWSILGRYGYKTEKPNKALLQYLGTEFGRGIDPDIWVNILKKRVDSINTEHLIVCCDCRFANELAAFPGALKIRLECDRDIRKSRAPVWRDNENHPSETSLDEAAKSNAFHLYYDSGKRSAQEIFDEVSSIIRQSAVFKDLVESKIQMHTDFSDLFNSTYSKWPM